MAGLYIHVPFCLKRCLYCDFYSNTDMSYKSQYVQSVIKEMELRSVYLKGETVETIYFGGGTPSQLAVADLGKLLDSAFRIFNISSEAEITLEANPDDIDDEYIESVKYLPINRVSMGVQSFRPEDLRFLNRRHTREQAIRAVSLFKSIGINNISVDLIYGLPGQTVETWKKNLDEVLRLDIPHISAYHLIYEEGTALYKLWKSGKVTNVDEDTSVKLFSCLITSLKKAGYDHYEISNFARNGYYSRHNSSYWKGISYLGLGPSAHSFNGKEREWNQSSLTEWIKGIEEGIPRVEIEEEDTYTQYNDYIITRLRTMWGINLEDIGNKFGQELRNYCLKQSEPYVRRGLLIRDGLKYRLSEQGIFVSDGIMSDLLWV